MPSGRYMKPDCPAESLAIADVVLRLEAAVAVQKTLFNELQHRVANSMQLVVSMLQLGARGLKDPAAVMVIDQAASRVGAMARLHRRLYDPAAYETVLNQCFAR